MTWNEVLNNLSSPVPAIRDEAMVLLRRLASHLDEQIECGSDHLDIELAPVGLN